MRVERAAREAAPVQSGVVAFRRALDPGLPIDERFHPAFVDHDAANGQPDGPDGLLWREERFAAAFSEVEREIVEVIATPERVVVVQTLSGTHTGDWRGHAATGRRFAVRAIEIAALQDGRTIGRWGSIDELGIVEQLGLR